MYHTGKIATNCEGKCGKCKHYEPYVKKDLRIGSIVEYCRGNCKIAHTYKQRTETCKKFEKE